jgi:hypothetical protein
MQGKHLKRAGQPRSSAAAQLTPSLGAMDTGSSNKDGNRVRELIDRYCIEVQMPKGGR